MIVYHFMHGATHTSSPVQRVSLVRPLLAALSVAVLSACSLAPAYQAPQADIATQYANDDVAALQPSDTAAQVTVPLSWTQLVQDAPLLALIDEVQQRHRSVEQAQITLAQLASSVDSADAARLPSINASANHTRQRMPADLTASTSAQINQQASVGLGISAFELDLFGSAANAAEAARQQYYAGHASTRAVKLSIASTFVSQYLQLQLHQQQQQLAARTVQTLQQRLELIQQRATAGLDNDLTLAQAKRELAATMLSQAQFDSLVAQDIHALETMLHRRLTDTERAHSAQAISQLSAVRAGLPADLLTQRPDIMAAEYQLKASHANIGLARAAYFPSIRLTTSAGTASRELSNLFKAGSGSWTFAPQLNLPLWDFGARAANLANANLERDLAVSKYQQSIEQAFREVADSLTAIRYGKTQLDAARDQHSNAMAALQLTQQREAAGLDSAIARLDAQRSWYTAASQQLQLDADLQVARLTLFKALGGETNLAH